MPIVEHSARKPHCDSGQIRSASFWRCISMTRANTMPTMLRREVPPVVVTFVPLALVFVYGNDLAVPHVLRYSSFLPALAKDFVQWEQ